jgi:hypothetical protein
MDYSEFLDKKTHAGAAHGFEPVWMPDALFNFQVSLVTWAIRKGRAAIFADCGLGKTAMQLTWAENVARHVDRSVLILTPLAVAAQTIREGEKFGIECHRSSDGSIPGLIVITNKNMEIAVEDTRAPDQAVLFDRDYLSDLENDETLP